MKICNQQIKYFATRGKQTVVVTWAIPKIKFNRYRRIYRLLSCIVFLFIK